MGEEKSNRQKNERGGERVEDCCCSEDWHIKNESSKYVLQMTDAFFIIVLLREQFAIREGASIC